MRDRRHPRSAPDYTAAALVMGLVNLLWVFLALWALVGFWSVLAAGLFLNAAIGRLETRRRGD